MRNILVLLAVLMMGVVALPAVAGDKDFDATKIERCKVDSVNDVAEKTEGVAAQWGEVRSKVDAIPGSIGEATGSTIENVDGAVEDLLALNLPITFDVASMKLAVDKEGLDEKQTKAADALDGLMTDLKDVPAAFVEIGTKAGEVGAEAAEVGAEVAGKASEAGSNPLKAVKLAPYVAAAPVIASITKWLTETLPAEVEATKVTLDGFFAGLGKMAEAAAANAAEAATTTEGE
jgi:hypothetical protein